MTKTPKNPTPIPDDLQEMAAKQGLTLHPVKTNGLVLFYIRKDTNIVYSGNCFGADELRQLWTGVKP